jgi:Zn-finger nucleic acid-binding protein
LAENPDHGNLHRRDFRLIGHPSVDRERNVKGSIQDMERAIAELSCPKCGGTMRALERQGIVIEMCGDCRGIFLDRGELDRMIDLEAGGPSRDRDPGYEAGYRDPRRRYRDDDEGDDKRGGFLSDLLGGLGD